MATIGIIGAMNSEIVHFCEEFGAEKQRDVQPDLYIGTCGAHKILIELSGIGKVNAAMAAQRLIDRYSVDLILHTGVAGGIAQGLSTCDVIIGQSLTYHDFHPLRILKENYPYASEFFSDPTLCSFAEAACKQLMITQPDFHYHIGKIVSGDSFVSDSATVKYLREEYSALCTEMEGAAIAHVCFANGIPFLVLRTISDFADEQADDSFGQFEQIAAERASFLAAHIIRMIAQR